MSERQTFARGTVGGIALLLIGCATSNIDAQWVDPQIGQRSLVGSKIYVVCQASDLTVRLVCADKMSAQIKAFGATPLVPPPTTETVDTVGSPPPPPNERLIADARAAGATVLFTAIIAPELTLVSAGPAFSIGLGGYSGGWGSGGGVGLGVGVPIGGVGSASTGYSANGALSDVDSARLMWSARATATPASDVNQQLADLAKTLLVSARSAGLFPS
jgi:hypothetical protein